MGYNTSVLIMNDAVHMLDEDPEFSKRLKDAILHLQVERRPIDVRIGNHLNACSVIESHHADQMQPLLIGGNTSHVIDGMHVRWNAEEMELDLLQQLAEKHGYVLHRARKAKSR